MKKSLNKVLFFLPFLLFFTLFLPFINGIGCDFKATMLSSPFGDFYATCQGGVIDGLVKPQRQSNPLKLKAIYGRMGGNIYIYIYKSQIDLINNNGFDPSLHLRTRTFLVGKIVKTERSQYVFYSQPESVLFRIEITGRQSTF